MVAALYRRYRPDTFQDLIGQEQVTGPLMTALERDRINHAYLFSGPRGCGKTTSARIFARCLNCAKGPRPTPCGECESCRELATGGPGSLDVIEIDAASHNGVDDARELRERAIFAPVRDRYKIFILDEAHMVTSAGFNALLKLVEEPPEHVKFIFATTEPDRVIGTIRSRTHHYPFRLVPPAVLLPYLEKVLAAEHLHAKPGVLPLAIRAGAGSVRDTLSVLDQLIAGSEGDTLGYERTVMLLGYTSTELLSRSIDALAVLDGNLLFQTMEQIMQAGLDPRRFAEDLLDRLRDLVLVRATGESADAVLQGTPADELGVLHEQAQKFGMAQLTRSASIVNDALNSMTGATNPRVQLEIMCAKLLLPDADRSEAGMLARLERLERAVDGGQVLSAPKSASVSQPASASTPQPKPEPKSQAAAHPVARPVAEPKPNAGEALPTNSVPTKSVPTDSVPTKEVPTKSAPADTHLAQDATGKDTEVQVARNNAVPAHDTPTREQPTNPPRKLAHTVEVEVEPDAETATPEAQLAPTPPAVAPADEPTVSESGTAEHPNVAESSEPSESVVPPEPASGPAPKLTAQQFRDAWPQILAAVEQQSRPAWTLISGAAVQHVENNVVTLAFPSQTTARSFRQAKSQHHAPDVLRQAIKDVFGVEVKYLAHVDETLARSVASNAPEAASGAVPGGVNRMPPEREPDDDDVPGWEPLPDDEYVPSADAPTADGPAENGTAGDSANTASRQSAQHTAQHGEAVLRERLGAVPIDPDRRY